jgi:hypothetical protein
VTNADAKINNNLRVQKNEQNTNITSGILAEIQDSRNLSNDFSVSIIAYNIF